MGHQSFLGRPGANRAIIACATATPTPPAANAVRGRFVVSGRSCTEFRLRDFMNSTRARLVMAVDPKDIETLGAKLDAWIALETALRDDLVGIVDLLDNASANQYLRRAFVRSLWGFIEGSLHGVLDFLRTARSLTGSDDADFPPDKGRTIDRVKAVLKIAARDLAHWEIDFGTTGWSAVRASLAVRDRLMHPKRCEEVRISDEEVDVVREATTWILATILEIQTRALHRAHRSQWEQPAATSS